MDKSVYLIAEAGVNHNGSIERALDMVDVAASAGADAIKFQTFIPSALASVHAAKAAYQRQQDPNNESQLAMLQSLALDFEAHASLLNHCRERDIDFLSSPFDETSADFLLNGLRLPTIKLGSGELTNGPLLWRIANSEAKLILSTGMSTMGEMETALGLCCLAMDDKTPASEEQCRAALDTQRLVGKITLMHCTSEYPCPTANANLRAMDRIAERFGLPVGYSDHTQGIEVSLAAVARGASVIEKHFTLERGLPGPDHAASLLPEELRALTSGMRTISQALGTNEKTPSPVERDNARVARKSLVAARDIAQGEIFTKDNLTSKRPGTGVTPLRYWALLGKPALHSYTADDLIREDE